MELIRALAVLVEPPSPEGERIAGLLELPPPPRPEEHTELFLRQLYPYASVYLGPEGMLGGEARDRVAGLWRALGETPPAEPDHLATLLGLHAHLQDLEGGAGAARHAAAWRRARTTLLHEHLVSWLPFWLQRVQELGGPFYRAWATLLGDALADAAEELGPAADLPSHFREMPALPDPGEEGGEAFLDAVLAAGRSGVVLTRADLARAAEGLGLGLRAGERRYVLTALLSQDPEPVLGWLAKEADRQLGTHASAPAWRRGSAVAEHWRGRAGRTAELLRVI